jgi:hypothetical protein
MERDLSMAGTRRPPIVVNRREPKTIVNTAKGFQENKSVDIRRSTTIREHPIDITRIKMRRKPGYKPREIIEHV